MIGTFAVLAALLAAAPAAAPAPPVASARWLTLSAEEATPRDLAQRVDEVSARFIGTPYIHSPLGEGEGTDPDPTVRFDAVDCLTYVEQVMALAVARSPADVPALLQQIRYENEEVSYAERNHLMEAQWLPNNVRKGFLRPMSQSLAGDDAVRTSKAITQVSWATESSKLLGLPEARHLTGTFELDVVPLGKVLEHARRAPSGTVVVIVRDERPRKVTRITHLGFITHRKNGRPMLRHAARNHYRKVVDEDLETFLIRNSKYTKWPVTGFAFYEVRAPDEAPELLAAETAGEEEASSTAAAAAP